MANWLDFDGNTVTLYICKVNAVIAILVVYLVPIYTGRYGFWNRSGKFANKALLLRRVAYIDDVEWINQINV